MKKFLLLAAGFLFLNVARAQTTYDKDIQDQITRFENGLSGRIKVNNKSYKLQERMAHFHVKGLSIAVVHNYKVIWAKGYGWADEKEKRPVTPETLFEPGSISKSLNAVGALKLVQDKKIDLHADINTYLRSWKFPYDSLSRNKKITLAHLLSHSAGLTVHGFPGYSRSDKIPTLSEVLDGKKPANTPAVRSAFEPGLKFQYSGGGTTISQLMIQDVTGEHYAKWMYEQVLKPMGMVNSSYNQPPKTDKDKLATGYKEDGSEVEEKFHIYPEQGAAGLWMTPSDLCNYIIETQRAYEGKSSAVLNKEMTRLRLSPYNDKLSALGVFVEQRGSSTYFSHSAGNEGFSGIYFGSLEGGNGVAVFINGDHAGSLLGETVNSVAQVYNWKDFYTPVIKMSVDVPEPIVSKYTGTYLFEGMLSTVLKKDDGYYFLSDGIYSKMHFINEKTFFNEEFMSEKTFEVDHTGNVTGYLRTVNGVKYPNAFKITNPDTLTAKPGQINDMGWYLLENKQFDFARRLIQRGLILSPDDVAAVGNLGHCYLFTNNYDKAIVQYKEFLETAREKDPMMTDMIARDFVTFKQKGFDTSLMDRAMADLKIDPPKAYKAN